MTGNNGAQRLFAVEEFLQALTAQLDRAQDALALKAMAGRPLTWALRDLSLDLQVFITVDPQGRVLMRSAGANEQGASTVHLALTTVTRPMVEENTWSFKDDADPRSLDDPTVSSQLDEGERRKLDYAGIRTIGQLKRVAAENSHRAVEAMVGIPVMRLGALLEASSRPAVSSHEVVRRADGAQLLRIHGANLSDGVSTEVFLGGEAAEVIEAKPQMLLVRPLSVLRDGPIEVKVANQRATGFVRVPNGGGAVEANVDRSSVDKVVPAAGANGDHGRSS